jgi:hypothetical protein
MDNEISILEDCAKQFRFYQSQHIAKNTEESLVKAEVNRKMAERIETFLKNHYDKLEDERYYS